MLGTLVCVMCSSTAQADAMVEWLRATLVRPRDARLQAMLERKRALWRRLGVDVERAQANHAMLASELGMSERQVLAP
jgi:hypothetical protein